MTDKISFLKTREVKSPSRAYEFDAGIDFYVPSFTANFIKDLKKSNPMLWTNDIDYSHISTCVTTVGTLVSSGSIYHTGTVKPVTYNTVDVNDSDIKFDEESGKNYFVLAPHSRINIPSGIKARMSSPGRALIAFNKSGIATKFGLIAGACVVDYLYQGEIHLSLINTSTNVVRIYEDMKIIQFVETPVFNSHIDVIPLNLESDPDKETRTFYKGMQTDRGEKGFDSSKNL